MIPLNELRFRSSPYIELKELGELTAEQREKFRDLENDPDFHGLFVPKPPLMMNLKSVGRQTADLFRTLATPARIDDAELADDVVDLVLDGILEIENGDGFVSGADAFALLCAPHDFSQARDATARLSHKALLHAQDLETHDPRTLWTALYLYNRIPITPFWTRRFADRDAILAHLGADGGSLRALLEREWMFSASMSGWGPHWPFSSLS